MALVGVLHSVFEDLREELGHVEVVNVLVDELYDWQDSRVEIAEDVHQRFEVVFATGS